MSVYMTTCFSLESQTYRCTCRTCRPGNNGNMDKVQGGIQEALRSGWMDGSAGCHLEHRLGLVRTSPSVQYNTQLERRKTGLQLSAPRALWHAAHLLLAAVALGIKVRVEGQLQGFLVQVSLLPRVQHLGGALRVGQGAG